jgi:hypothetical protein
VTESIISAVSQDNYVYLSFFSAKENLMECSVTEIIEIKQLFAPITIVQLRQFIIFDEDSEWLKCLNQ